MLTTIKEISELNGHVSLENLSMNTWLSQRRMEEISGWMKLNQLPRASKISFRNMLLKGSIFKHRSWVYGLVAFTGQETYIHRMIIENTITGSYITRIRHRATIAIVLFSFLVIMVSTAKTRCVSGDFTHTPHSVYTVFTQCPHSVIQCVMHSHDGTLSILTDLFYGIRDE